MSDEKSMTVRDEIPWELLKQTVNIHQKAGLIPRGTTFEQAMVCQALGHQLGIPRFEAMRGIVVVDGKPTLMAGLLQAVVQRSIPGLEIVLVKYSRDECIVKGRRSPKHEWTEITFDMEDAKLAGLANKRNWQQYPKAMLYARASTVLLRMLGADVVHGLYTPDEFGADEDPDGGTVRGVAMARPVEPAPIVGATHTKVVVDEAARETFTEPLGTTEQVDKATGEITDVPFTPKEEAPEPKDEVDELAARIAQAAEKNDPEPEPDPEPKKRKPRSDKGKKRGPRGGDRFTGMDEDALMEEASKLEDTFSDGREGEELTVYLDARSRAQAASPNWDTTEDKEELLLYCRNLEAEYQKVSKG